MAGVNYINIPCKVASERIDLTKFYKSNILFFIMIGIEIFLIILALIWLIFAVISDLKTREVPNWLNFSLIIFAL